MLKVLDSLIVTLIFRKVFIIIALFLFDILKFRLFRIAVMNIRAFTSDVIQNIMTINFLYSSTLPTSANDAECTVQGQWFYCMGTVVL